MIGWLNVAPGADAQLPVSQAPVWHAQLDIVTVTDWRLRLVPAKRMRSPSSAVCVAWKPTLGTFPGSGSGIES